MRIKTETGTENKETGIRDRDSEETGTKRTRTGNRERAGIKETGDRDSLGCSGGGVVFWCVVLGSNYLHP